MKRSQCLLLLLVFSFQALCQELTIEKKIEQIITSYPAVGLVVAVVKNNKIIYTQSFGYQNKEENRLLQNDNLFRIASISKSFTATALLQLVEKKLISLDDDVSNLIGFTVRNPNHPEIVITLRMLLSHRSSLNDSQGYFNLDVVDPSTSNNYQKCYNTYAPGEGYQYCNLNFNMAGTILERLTGERFDSYIKKQILNPLGIEGGYNIDSLDQTKFAMLYDFNGKEEKFTPNPGAYASRATELATYKLGRSTPIFSPTGGMKIAAEGLAKYMLMHSRYGKYAGGRILRKKTSKLMQTPLSLDGIDQYGLALWKTNKLIPEVELTGHTGSAYGLNSAFFFNPKQKFGLVVICNGSKIIYKDGYPTILSSTLNVLYNNFIK
ncbi:MAG: class A beta-lactamase-related serine hydrolase [Chitinophagia bacterium]|nr:class A beta-lactamase-related serine hydrolase [Chitinophagia bacterium]